MKVGDKHLRLVFTSYSIVLQMGEPVQVNQRGYSSKAYSWVLR